MTGTVTAVPGQGWFEIIRRPTPESFASAFTADVVLIASVTSAPIVGPDGVGHFFEATRAMYDSIGFVHETSAGSRTWLEWAGRFQGRDVAGLTVLCRDEHGLIDAIQLFHSPYEQVVAFSAELARRLEGKLVPSPFAGK